MVIDKYYNHRNSFEKSLPELPIELVWHCSYDYPMFIIALPDTKKIAWRGAPRKVSIGEMMRAPVIYGTSKIVEFCNKYGIDISELTPSWWLVSMYG